MRQKSQLSGNNGSGKVRNKLMSVGNPDRHLIDIDSFLRSFKQNIAYMPQI